MDQYKYRNILLFCNTTAPLFDYFLKIKNVFCTVILKQNKHVFFVKNEHLF